MQNTDHLIWDTDPVAFDTGIIQLPFPISILGIIAAFIFIYIGFKKFVPVKTNDSGEPDVSSWKFWSVILGSFILGQLIFFIIPSPAITEFGPVQIRWYSLLFASSFLVGYFIMQKIYFTASRSQEELDRLFIYILIATIIGARLGHVIFYDLNYFLRHPVEIFLPIKLYPSLHFTGFQGLASHGAAIGIIIAMYLFVKNTRDMKFLWLADRVVFVVALAGAFIRTGNFMNSEIIGEPTDLPWAIIFPRLDMVPRHPSMLYEAVLCLIVFALLWKIYSYYDKKPPHGSLFGTFLALLFTGRFFIEFTKIDQAEFASEWAINMGQWLSIPLIIIGIWLIVKKVNWDKPQPLVNKGA